MTAEPAFSGLFARLMPWRRPRLNVIELHGLIMAREGTLNATSVAPLIERAFRSAHRAAGDPGHREPGRFAGAV